MTEKREWPEADKRAVDYAIRYGGMCRGCADTRVKGVCDSNGTPCESGVFAAALRHGLSAWRYGIEHGYIHNPLASALIPAEPPVAVSRPDAYQQFKDGKWVECSEFVARGFGSEVDKDCRALYATPPTADLQAEADKWKHRWQDKADAFEVQEQTIAVLRAEKEHLENEKTRLRIWVAELLLEAEDRLARAALGESQ